MIARLLRTGGPFDATRVLGEPPYSTVVVYGVSGLVAVAPLAVGVAAWRLLVPRVARRS